MSIGLYGKAFSGSVVAGLGAYSTALQDGGTVSNAEWIAVALSFIASFGIIWAIPLTPKVVASYGKLVFAGLTAGGSSLITGLVDNALSQTEIITAVTALAIATGLTGIVPNAAASDPVLDGKMVAVPLEVKAALLEDGPTSTVINGQEVLLAGDETDFEFADEEIDFELVDGDDDNQTGRV